MATVTAYQELDMSVITTWYGNVTTATSTTLAISDSYRASYYTGYSFAYGGTTVTGGTLTGQLYC